MRFAQNMTIDFIEELPSNAFDAFINSLSGAFSLPLWSGLVIGLLVLACLAFALYLQSRQSRKNDNFCLVDIVSVISVSSFGLALDKQARDAQQSEAIIFA